MSGPRSLPVALKPYAARMSPGSAFGVKRVVNGIVTSTHNGCDFPTPVGLPLESGIEGTVSKVGGSMADQWGYYVHVRCKCPLRHEQEFHILRDKPTFKLGDPIKLGQVVGYTGRSGSFNGKPYAPHHHQGSSVGGKYYNPLSVGWPDGAGNGSNPFDNEIEDDMFTDQDRADQQSIMLALGAGGLVPGQWADEDNVTAVSRANRGTLADIKAQITNLENQVLGTRAGYERTNVVQRLKELQSAVGTGGVDVDKLADAIVARLPKSGITAGDVVSEIAKQWAK